MSLRTTTWHTTHAAPAGVLRTAKAVGRTVGGHDQTENHQEKRSTAMSNTLIEMQARHQIQERLSRASAPRMPVVSRRHRVAERLRKVADRVDS